jgi:anhydro-N-acetylmuramic acid kinase
MAKYDLDHKVHFIASHGHTIFHDPENKTTGQIGDGAAIAAVTALPVISDLRAMDIALGGQGAPIVPVGDRLLFGDYKYWLNLGGIANVSVKTDNGMVAFDLCPCNQLLDYFAKKKGLDYDDEGKLAASGKVSAEFCKKLSEIPFYELPGPKSLSNDFAKNEVIPMLDAGELSEEDALATGACHIADQITTNISRYQTGEEAAKLLVTGGGAFNKHLISMLEDLLKPINITVTVPDEQVIQFKEALVMALLGALRWREEENIFSSVTGAERDSIGGALWLGR